MSLSRLPMNASVNQGHTGRQGLVLQCLGQCDINIVDEIVRLSPVVSVWLFLDNKYHVRRQPHAFLVTFARVRQFCSLNNQVNWEYTCTVNGSGTESSMDHIDWFNLTYNKPAFQPAFTGISIVRSWSNKSPSIWRRFLVNVTDLLTP